MHALHRKYQIKFWVMFTKLFPLRPEKPLIAIVGPILT